MERKPLVAVVGAGFCGTVAAIHLLREPALGRVVLVERPGHGVGGVAYDVASPRLVLNVPARRMSAFADAPDDFVDFLRARDPGIDPSVFAPRRDYGAYLATRLRDAEQAAAGDRGPALERLAGDVRDVRRDADGRLRLVFEPTPGSADLPADAVLVATGGPPPVAPRWLEPWMVAAGRYADAWAPGAVDGLGGGTDDTVVLIGTGLTAADLVLELRAAGFDGRIVAVSRHGLLPRMDDGAAPAPRPDDLAVPGGDGGLRLRPLVRAVRAAADRAAAEGRDWRAIVAAVRLQAPTLWQRLDERERARFLRHVRAWWDVHRHRLPRAIAMRLGAEIREGRLEIVAGRAVAAARSPGSADGLALTIAGRDGTRTIDCRRVLNCTGAAAGASLLPPWPALLARGTAVRDPLGLGVLADDDGRLLDAAGRPQPGLHYAGPMWRARDWEATAVPELRERLPRVAASVARFASLA